MENARLSRQLQERANALSKALEQQTAITDLLKTMSRSMFDLQPLLDALIEKAAKLCNASEGLMYRFDGSALQLAASHNASDNYKAMRLTKPILPGRGSGSGRVLLERRVVHIPDVLADPEYEVMESHRVAGYRTLLCVPLLRESKIVGSMSLWRLQVRPFTPEEIDLVLTFADQAVIAMENVRLLQELRKSSEELAQSVAELRALGEVGATVSSSLDLPTVLSTILTHAVQLSRADSGTIYEFDESREVFIPRANYGLSEDYVERLRESQIRVGDGAVGRAAALRTVVQIPDVAQEQNYVLREIIQRAGFRALLGVPLLREDRVIGGFVIRRRVPGEFPQAVVRLLQAFAAQSVLAIQNAQMFKEIQEKSDQLAVASQHKSQFLASMSHELRTPLNAILGFNEMILDGVYGDLAEDLKAPLENMQSSGKHLLRLINNVLDLAKIEAGRMELALSDYSVQDMVANVHSTLQPLAADKGLEFVVSVANDIPLAYGDVGRIAQCLMNLVGNSLKFTASGKVEIVAEQKVGRLVYRVADTGIGIPPEKIGSLFTEFKQTDATIASEYGGTGLGLSITRKFVEMHGGRVSVESELGKGSTFLFEVPLRVAA